MKKLCFSILFVFQISCFTSVYAEQFTQQSYAVPVQKPYIFAKNKPTKALVELGRILFFDKRVSGNNSMSCATCHRPDKFWSDGLKLGIGHNGVQLNRSTPTLINAAYNKKQFWDGRASSLEQQSTMPIESPQEMNQNLDELVIELKGIKGYVALFAETFQSKRITRANISRALAAFQRSLTSENTVFDRWYLGENDVMSKSAIRGFKIFEGKAECVECHSGFNFTDDEFHNIGLKSYAKSRDMGRYDITGNFRDKGAFKTPTLRNVVNTAPYMHDGSIQTIDQVIDFYNEGGIKNENIDEDMKKLNLTQNEKSDLIAFLKTLSGNVQVSIPVSFPK